MDLCRMAEAPHLHKFALGHENEARGREAVVIRCRCVGFCFGFGLVRASSVGFQVSGLLQPPRACLFRKS